MVITLGEALVSLTPTAPVTLDRADELVPRVGGAEVNFAIGLSRLGVTAGWLGRLGADALGDVVLRTLEAEGVDARWTVRDAARPTGVYFREWLADGERRPYYYRAGSAASAASVADWPAQLPAPRWLHVSGITLALGEGPAQLVEHAVAWARERGVPISFDPNHRTALWSEDAARPVLRRVAAAADVLVMTEEEGALLFGADDPASCIDRAHALGPRSVVVKRGEHGAVGSAGGALVERPASAVERVLDPVGAGDGFAAALVAALLADAPLEGAIELAAYVGARAVEQVGEHPYPTAAELPAPLRRVLDPATADAAAPALPSPPA
jgi:2-dehydro-3-deoxygluconokinase